MPFYSSVSGNFSSIGRSVRPPNIASGGTETTFTKNGALWKRHIFSTAGTATFTVTRGLMPFNLTVVGGGGGGAGNPDGFGTGGSGSSGGFYSADVTLPASAITVTVGAGGTGQAGQPGGGQGYNGGQGGLSKLNGYWIGGGGKGGQAFGQGTPVAGTGNPTPAADGGVASIDYSNHGLTSTVGTGGAGAAWTQGGNNGQSGAVVIEYPL